MADDPTASGDTSGAGNASADSTAISEIASNGSYLNEAIGNVTSAIDTLMDAVIPAPSGGTGHDVYAVGDLLAADTTTSLERLADVATGNALLSGGVNTLPFYGKVTPSHFSGTLAVNQGGTGDATLTAHAVLLGEGTSPIAFAAPGASGQVLQSNGATVDPTFRAFVDGIGGMILTPINQAYRFWINSPFACTITSTTTICVSGTCTLTFNVSGGGIGGSANAVSTVQQVQTHSTAVAAGQYIEGVVSANASCTRLSFMIAITRP